MSCTAPRSSSPTYAMSITAARMNKPGMLLCMSPEFAITSDMHCSDTSGELGAKRTLRRLS